MKQKAVMYERDIVRICGVVIAQAQPLSPYRQSLRNHSRKRSTTHIWKVHTTINIHVTPVILLEAKTMIPLFTLSSHSFAFFPNINIAIFIISILIFYHATVSRPSPQRCPSSFSQPSQFFLYQAPHSTSHSHFRSIILFQIIHSFNHTRYHIGRLEPFSYLDL